MAWMTDEEYEFVKDSMDKKNVARSASHKRTHAGKRGSVKFPSDYLSKKELKAMSGECIKYASLKKPMNWDEFKVLPDDLKKEYINSIRDKFGAPDTYIAEMLGVSQKHMSLYFKDLGLNLGKGCGNGRRKWEREQFYAWKTGADPELVKGEPVDIVDTEEDGGLIDIPSEPIDCPVEEPVVESVKESTEGQTGAKICAIPKNGNMTFKCQADLALNTIAQLLGNTNVLIEINWTVIPDVISTDGLASGRCECKPY